MAFEKLRFCLLKFEQGFGLGEDHEGHGHWGSGFDSGGIFTRLNFGSSERTVR